MAPSFLQATPDRALRFLTSSAVNRRVASSNLARGAISLLPNDLDFICSLFFCPLAYRAQPNGS